VFGKPAAGGHDFAGAGAGAQIEWEEESTSSGLPKPESDPSSLANPLSGCDSASPRSHQGQLFLDIPPGRRCLAKESRLSPFSSGYSAEEAGMDFWATAKKASSISMACGLRSRALTQPAMV